MWIEVLPQQLQILFINLLISTSIVYIIYFLCYSKFVTA
jgi:hypothetical protein